MSKPSTRREMLRKSKAMPNTNLGWAEYYALRHIKDPSNTQAEHLSYLHLLFHESRDLPKEEAKQAIALKIQAEVVKCLNDHNYLQEFLTEHITKRVHHAIPNPRPQHPVSVQGHQL